MPRLYALLAVVLSAFTAPVALATEPSPAPDDGGWISAAKARTPEDISLWTRMVPGAELKAFRGATHVKVPMESMVAFAYDTAAMPDWVFRCKQARILADNPDGSVYVYMTIDGIWPLEDRDAVVKVTPEYVPATGEVRLTGIAAPDYFPHQPGFIRIPSIETSWSIRPVDDGMLRVEWTGHVDPAGNVPRWLANSVATIIPRYTLKHLRELVADPKWQRPEHFSAGEKLLDRVKQHPVAH